uniref:Uncharacterized protein n=1 Tax=Musa acuminata subsp. malaccensis TaxID=214687 RepID=A0A804J7Q3_MUSAM
MRSEEARKILGFSPDSCPTRSEIAEAYSSLGSGARSRSPYGATTVRVVRTGVPMGYGKGNRALITIPFLLLIAGTVSFAGLNAARAYKRQEKMCPSYNPFLP